MSFFRFFSDIKKYGAYTLYASYFQLKNEIAESKLKWVWWILEPLVFMLLFFVVFGTLFHSKEKCYALFIFIGVSFWDFFNRSIRKSAKLIKHNNSTLRNAYVPKYMLVLQVLLINGFKLFISMILSMALVLFYGIKLSRYFLLTIPIVLLLFILTFGISCLVMHAGVYIGDLPNVIHIALKIMFYLTGVFYSIEKKIPQPYGKMLLHFNPLAFLITKEREVIIYSTFSGVEIFIIWLIIAIVILIIAICIIYKREGSYLKIN